MRQATSRTIGMCFDLDGVLWDTSSVHAAAFEAVARTEGLRSVPYDRLAGLTTRDAWGLVLEENARPADGRTIERLTWEKQSLARRSLRARPPINEDLFALDTFGCRTALVTGASRQTAEIFLRAAAPIHIFDVVVTAESADRGKPASDPYEVAASLLELEPHRCWALEDSVAGIESARAARARVVHFARDLPCGHAHARTETCLSSLREFIALVRDEFEAPSCRPRS